MVNNLTIGANVWVMHNNQPKKLVVAQITTIETITGKKVIVGLGTHESSVLAPYSDYAVEDLYESSKALQIGLFGEDE